MDFTLKCLIFVTLTSASAFNQRDFRSARSLNPQRSRPVIYQLNNHNYQPGYRKEPPPDKPNEQQRMDEKSIISFNNVQIVQELEIKKLQTRDEAYPRADNRSYYNIVNVNPEPYPAIANRRGEVRYDDVEIPEPDPSYSRYVPDIPENCKNLGICDKINNYPHDVVNRIFKELSDKSKNRIKIEVPKKPKIETRQGGEDEIELCKLNETVVFPQAAQTEDGEWYVILNPDGVKLQGFRIHICESSNCASLVEFPYGYTARCKQKYVQRAMAAVDVDKREIIYDKTFRVPSCCSCVTSPYY